MHRTGTPRLSTAELLARLVSFDTTSRNSNLALIGFVRDYLDAHGIPYRVSTDATGEKGQHPRHHRPTGPGRHRAVRSCRYRAGGRPGLERRSVHAAPSRRPALCARRGRHEGLRLRLPRRGARISRRATSRGRCTCSSATTRRSAATARSGCIQDLDESGLKPALCVVGEPSGMQPILAHKGKLNLRVTRARPDRAFQRARQGGQRHPRRRRGDRLCRRRSAPAGEGRPVRGRLRSAAHHDPCRHHPGRHHPQHHPRALRVHHGMAHHPGRRRDAPRRAHAAVRRGQHRAGDACGERRTPASTSR